MKQLYLLISIFITSIAFAQDAKLTVSVPDGTNAVRLTGPFWSWAANGGPEAVDNGNGTWTVTLSPAPSDQMQYKWVLDGTLEDLVAAAAGGGCSDRGGDADVAGPHMITNYFDYANRIWKVGDGDIVNDVAGSCGTFLNTSNGFDNVASTIGWTGIADATSSDATLEFDGTNGNTGGALKLTGTNPDTNGKAYIFEYTDSDFNYTNASDVKIQFDAKFDGNYNGAVHMQTQMPGSGTLNTYDIQNDGINENTWTAIEYDFEDVQPTGTNDIFRIHFNLAAAAVVGGGGSLLIDNLVITLSGDGTPEPDPAPTDAPTAPTEDAADVISIFSDAYNDVAATFNPNWQQNTLVSNETFAGNAVKKYKNFNYSGIVPDATIDVNSHSSIKLDYWTADAATIKVKFRDYGANNVYDEAGDDIEHEIIHTVSTTSAWQTLQINLADFNTLTAKNIGQIILSATVSGSGNALVYFDNIYFSKTTLGVGELSRNDISIYPNPVQNTLNVSAGATVDSVSIFDLTGRQVLRATPNAAAFSLDVANLNKGLYLVSLKAGDKEMTTKLVK